MSESGSKNTGPRQSGQYDKVLRENLEVTLPVFIREVLGIEVAESEELPDDVQHTKERKPDALKKITTVSGETFLLHMEFQVEDEDEMVFRMAEYYIMLMRRYHLPVRQYVIFLRDKKPLMAKSLHTDRLKFSYELLEISSINYRLFLNAANPEVKMLAILADFANNDSYSVVKEIVEDIRGGKESDFAESRYFKQYVSLYSYVAA